jgi:hypothetical protein
MRWGMRYWAAVIEQDQYATERLYAYESLSLDAGGLEPSVGEPVVLVVASEPPMMFGLGKVRRWYGGGSSGPVLDPDGSVIVTYTHRMLDDPVPAPLSGEPGFHEISEADYERLAAGVGADRRTDADKSEWFVSVALPIEAASRAEAVREFWTYVAKLGPRELPAFVWPKGDELSMQAYVLGAETTLDPEEDDED